MSGDFGPWPGLVGATMPLVDPSRGMDRWAPLNLSKDDPVKFDRYRGAELKHGRVGAPVDLLQSASGTTCSWGSLLTTNGACMRKQSDNQAGGC